MRRWDERKHPRDGQGQFTEKWASRLSAAMAPTVGVSRDPQDWVEGSPRQAYQEIQDKLRGFLQPWYQNDPDGLEKRISYLLGTVIPVPARVYKQGPHRIYIATSKPVPIQRLQTLLADLDAVAPSRDPIHLRVQPRQYMVNAGAYAETIRGSGIMAVSDDLFDDVEWNQHQAQKPSHFMPVAHQRRGLDYILAHEWGHVIDYPDRPGADEHAQSILAEGYAHAFGDYGNKTIMEAHAEAFAEWYLTGGQSDNEAAQAYADMYGWEGYG